MFFYTIQLYGNAKRNIHEDSNSVHSQNYFLQKNTERNEWNIFLKSSGSLDPFLFESESKTFRPSNALGISPEA